MGAAQADHADDTVTISACNAVSLAIDQPIGPETQLTKSVIGDIGKHIDIRSTGKRNAMFGNIGLILRRIKHDVHYFL